MSAPSRARLQAAAFLRDSVAGIESLPEEMPAALKGRPLFASRSEAIACGIACCGFGGALLFIATLL